MSEHRPTGWNTWDFRGFNRLVLLDRGRTAITVQYAVWDEDHRPADEVKNRGGLYHTFRWADATRLGPHAPLGLPAVLEFVAGDTPYRAEAVERDGSLELTVTPLEATRQRVVFVFLAPVGETVERTGPESGRFAGFPIDMTSAAWPHDYHLNVAEPYALGRPGEAATLRVGLPPNASADAPTNVAAGASTNVAAGASPAEPPVNHPIPAPPQAHDSAIVNDRHDGLIGHGALAEAPEAMTRAVTWNTLFDTRRRLVSSPVSRDWCADWKGVSVWCWDTFLVAGLISTESPQLARLNFEAVTAAIDELGMVPNYYMAHGAASRDRSMPPLGSYMIWKVQQASQDTSWLDRIYPRLAMWHDWWFANRDGNGDGLLEWGSNAEPKFEFPQLLQDNPQLRHSAKCALYESGLDNSPMYDDVPFNEKANTLELADVGLNAFYAMDCESLAAIAGRLGRLDEAQSLRDEYEAVKQRINDRLWDDEHGIYCNRHWDGRRSPRWSPTSFFPMIAGIAPRDRAERMVREHLLNEDEFWGEFIIPSISRSDPAFADNDYWRGRIWGPFNFLVAEGLRRYRFDDLAARFAQKSLDLFMRNWRTDGGVYENYNAVTGAGGGVWNAARLYHWGGLMVLIAIQELIDVEPAGYLRLGSMDFPDAGIQNVRVGTDRYDVTLDDGVRVRRNGVPWLDCTRRAIVRIPLVGTPHEAVEVSATADACLTLYDPAAPARSIRLNGNREIPPTGGPRPLRYQWRSGQE